MNSGQNLKTKNPFRLYLKKLFKQLSIINGLYHVVHSQVQQKMKSFKETDKEDRLQTFLGAALVYRDLIDLVDTRKFAKPHIVNPFTVRGDDFFAVYKLVVENEGGLSIFQAYEAFESFLINIMEYLLANHKKYLDQRKIEHYKKAKGEKHLGSELLRDFIKYEYRDNNEKLRFLRKVFTLIEKCEKSNYKNINHKNWFKVLTMVRHAVVHSNFTIKPTGLNRLSLIDKEILSKYFPGTLEKNGFYRLGLDYKSMRDNFEIMCDYSYLLIRSISVELGLGYSSPMK